MSDIDVDDFSHLTTFCPNTVLDQLSVVLSKTIEESARPVAYSRRNCLEDYAEENFK
jgi:hypothetical protein